MTGDGRGARDRAIDRLASLRIWPIVAVDFEASGLHSASYPVEVGVCRWPSPVEPIATWSRVIRPCPEWAATRWDPRAEQIHGLAPTDLEAGVPAAVVAREIASRLEGVVAVCDGSAYDAAWMRALTRHGNVEEPPLASPDTLASAAGPKMARWLIANGSPHRAGPDAQRIVRAFAYAFGLRPDRDDDMTRGWPDGESERCAPCP